MEITIPEFCLVVLVGPSGSGKSTFARKHFKPTEILGSDDYRAIVSDDENNQLATRDAFEVLHLVAEKRLAAGRLTVVDATNVQPQARQPLLALAHQYYCQPVAIVFDLPDQVCIRWNQQRALRNLGPEIIHRQIDQLHRSLPGLLREEFRSVFVFHSPQDVDSAVIHRRKMENNHRDDSGPFDLIGDVHGCLGELEQLLDRLGYISREEPDLLLAGTYGRIFSHSQGRKAVFLGDLVDRGPRILDTLQLVRGMVISGSGLCVLGNHEEKLLRKLRGRNV
ncbi:MAG TPA: AAA family ATPase, partial [Anaerolineaceae bacterium]